MPSSLVLCAAHTRRLAGVLTALALVAAAPPLAAQTTADAAAPPHAITPQDIAAWTTIRGPQLDPGGRWLAYVLSPNEGDAEVVFREVRDGGRELRFPIGEIPGRNGSGRVLLAEDGRWGAFLAWPDAATQAKARASRRPVRTDAVVANLADGTSRRFENIADLGFAGPAPRLIALHAAPPADGGTANGASGNGAPSGAAARARGRDLLLLELSTGTMVNVGNVAEFAFDERGTHLAVVIDAASGLGNGVQLRDLATGAVRTLDAAERARYTRLAWTDSLPALTAIRQVTDSAGRDTTLAIVAAHQIGTPRERVVSLAATGRADWPAGTAMSTERTVRWTQAQDGLYFGVRALPPRDSAARGDSLATDDRPSLMLWHEKDPRLQSMQQVQERADRSFSFLAAWWPDADRVVLLTDSVARTGQIVDDRVVLATDVSPYERQASVDGIRRRDLYAVDPRTGTKRLLHEGQRFTAEPSPDGRRLAWFDDGEWHVTDIATGTSRPLTRGGQFIDVEDDHNVDRPPYPFLGWSADSRSFVVSDGWDAWRISADGGAPVNLTKDGKARGIRYGRPLAFDPRARGLDLASPLWFDAREERTKREALVRVAPDGRVTAGPWREASIAPRRARDADTWVAAIGTYARYPDWWRIAPLAADSARLTDGAPGMNGVAWSPGARLVTYVGDKGDTLQGALFLPAGYEPGKAYPTVTYIYEKMSDNLHTFYHPQYSSSYTPSLYTSRGYAVFMPDITYTINDPGMSAVWNVLPALDAAIATGVVDSARVGLHGHSWGGYQTAFLVGQTNRFAAAVAGAPLTDMVSMYSSVYWNTGSANQPIFQSSQGRFAGNFLEHREAYERNSPNRYADRIETPLVILHNDKDGAVDFNQGITFYNTLRQLGKDVILLEYVGENHGLAELKNRRDYTLRLMDFWAHHLRGEPAPRWLQQGVPRLEMDDEFREMRKRYEQPKADPKAAAKPKVVSN